MLSLICLYFLPILNFSEPKEPLTEYHSFAHFDVTKYTKAADRTFDTNGIIMQKKIYHPLTISIYGIMSYDAFIRTGDSTHYYAVLHQYNYFADPSKLIYSDSNQSVGLPYQVNFKEMKAPWFSGMTQGTAVSFLLRYYALTKNETALELSKKIIHLMLKKEEDGGTIGRTAEGGPWIEEYPRSKGSKSVLNGFINGWIGLHEYCLMFPQEREAAAIRDSCYDQMINNMFRFDTPTGTSYNRNGGGISNMYLRYEIQEFDHLYALLRDVRLRNQMRIWARMAKDKIDKETPFYTLPLYQYATQLPGNPANDSCVFNDSKNFAAGLTVQPAARTKRHKVEYKFNDDRYYCELQITGGEAAKNRRITFEASKDGEEVPVQCTYGDNSIVIESSSPFDKLELKYPSKKYREQCTATLRAYDYRVGALPMFAFFNFSRIENIDKGKTCYFEFEGLNLTNATVYYRFGKDSKLMLQEEFKIQQTFLLKGGTFTAPETGVYEFFVSYDVTHPRSTISKLKLVRM